MNNLGRPTIINGHAVKILEDAIKEGDLKMSVWFLDKWTPFNLGTKSEERNKSTGNAASWTF